MGNAHGCSQKGGFRDLLGIDPFVDSSLTKKGNAEDSIDFLVPSSKQPNYLKYCSQIELPLSPVETLNLYTGKTIINYYKLLLNIMIVSYFQYYF